MAPPAGDPLTAGCPIHSFFAHTIPKGDNMSARTIAHDESFDTIWGELVYTEARLMLDSNAEDLAAEFTSLLGRLEKVGAGQRKVWRGEIIAQVRVDAENDSLDDTTEDIGDAVLRAEEKDRTSARYRRYFGARRPSEVIKMGLESQLGVMKPWVEPLKTEPEEELKKLGARLEGNVETGTVAVEGRVTAATNSTNFRVRERMRFVDDVNAVRDSVHGILAQRAVKKKLGKDWPDRFFRRGSSSARKKGGDGEDKGGGGGAGGGGGGSPA